MNSNDVEIVAEIQDPCKHCSETCNYNKVERWNCFLWRLNFGLSISWKWENSGCPGGMAVIKRTRICAHIVYMHTHHLYTHASTPPGACLPTHICMYKQDESVPFFIYRYIQVSYVYVHIFCKNDRIYCWKFNCVTTWVTQHARTTERTTCKVMLALRSDGGRRHEQVDRCWFDLVPIIHRCLAPSILQTNRSEIYF